MCGRLVTSIENGWVEWLVGEEDRSGNCPVRGLRLVHRTVGKSNCRYNLHKVFQEHSYIVEGLPLARFVGADGLMLLLSLLATGEMHQADILELTKRLQIPGYEQVREMFPAPEAQGIVNPAIADRYYLQSEIHELLLRAQKRSA